MESVAKEGMVRGGRVGGEEGGGGGEREEG